MTIRIPKWGIGLIVAVLIGGIAAGAYLLGRSNSSSSTTASTTSTHPKVTTTKGPVMVAVEHCPTSYGFKSPHPTIPDRIRLSRPIPTQPRLVFWANEQLAL